MVQGCVGAGACGVFLDDSLEEMWYFCRFVSPFEAATTRKVLSKLRLKRNNMLKALHCRATFTRGVLYPS